jgi:hypothetical protein
MYRKKGAWNLTSTRLPGKIGLLTRVLVYTMALANIQILCFLGHHRLIPVIGHRGLGGDFSLCCVPNILERVSPCRSNRHGY